MMKPASLIRCFAVLAAMILFVLPGASASGGGPDNAATGTWLVRIAADADPEEVASRLGAEYAGPLEGVDGYHRLRFFEELSSRPGQARETILRKLESVDPVIRFEEEVMLTRYPRSFVPDDPRFPDQWHLENVGQSGGLPFADIRVRPAWDAGLSGSGVTVAVVDEGIQYRHPDLEPNWLPGSGYDYNDDDSDPSPSGFEDRHGTAVAGITLAAGNDLGGLGVAYAASLVPLRLIAGPFPSGAEVEALSRNKQVVDIYNNSWGPSDDAGVRYVGISRTLRDALEQNTATGRGGLGNIYVWAAGNGGLNGDNSNYDGYNASPYTISVGAVGHDDIRAGYSEPGANLLVVAPSGGRGGGILTTDNTGPSGYDDGDTYDNFSGTSAATPVVSGVVALLLEKRPDLGWRDVQQILALTATPVDFDEGWSRNAAGYWASHEYGFGRVDASAAVRLAEQWTVLPRMLTTSGSFGSFLGGDDVALPQFQTVERPITISDSIRVQHVMVTVSLTHADWGDLRIEIESPSGTRSVLAEEHANANQSFQPGTWTFLSTHFLHESSEGDWTLRITDEGSGGSGTLDRWEIEIRGTALDGSGNRPPSAGDLSIQSVTYPVEVDVLQGVRDPDGDPVELLSVQYPRAGYLEDLGNGRFRYSMENSKDGTDVFGVLLSDGQGRVARRLVHVLDPRPVGRNDLYPVLSGTSTRLPVLSNDLDPDADPLRLTGLSGNYRGAVSIQPDGSLLYTPPAGFSGVERIRYALTDDSDGESTGWATVIVQETPEVALDFDGEDDYLRLEAAPSVPTTDQFTVEAWIYPEEYGEYVTGFGRIIDRRSFIFFLNGFDHTFYNDQSLVAYFVLNDGGAVAVNTGPGTLELNRWQHVALSYDSSNPLEPVRIYVDGRKLALDYPLDNTSPPDQPMTDNGFFPLYIGESDSGARAFNGRITEVRIWDGVISPQQIQSFHDRQLTGNEPGLQLYFRFDQTLEPEAVSLAGGDIRAGIYEARRVPLEFPWADLEARFTLLSDEGSGWWEERTLGRLYGDLFPWIHLPDAGWAYTGHGVAENNYTLFFGENGIGWAGTSPAIWPWLYQFETASWLYLWEGLGSGPAFYSYGTRSWLPGPASSGGG